MANNLTKGTTRPDKNIKRRVEIACKRLSWRALEVLEEAMDSEEADHRTKIMAAKEVLDRAWGKPRVKVDAEVTHAPSEEFLALMNKAQERVVEGRVIENKIRDEETKAIGVSEQDIIDVAIEQSDKEEV